MASEKPKAVPFCPYVIPNKTQVVYQEKNPTLRLFPRMEKLS